ncbi:tRNA (adenine(22)-N(1))-methyltransferase [Paenibacillus thermotolerans]|uniref:tRNA (adenine(22)-N(1))-methyltransferase n=1 Tax=Paenibacillus thermotolerans TaxID=3027807 RepID=UPI00236870D4|nr:MULTISPECIES: class I SAM-dependent methyltransferase [unclassified Paenibacillus]
MTSMMQLSKRLEAITTFIPRGSAVADIGSDHAMLPVFLLQQGIASHAVAGEVNEGPYRAACRQVAQAGLTERISVRLGDGLAVISPEEVDVIVIAGMGGGTIVEILTEGEAQGKLKGVSRLVLQPNIGERLVREWFIASGWKLSQELLLSEDGIAYEILVADASAKEEADAYNEALYCSPLPGFGAVSKDLKLLVGPLQLAHPNDVFIEKWNGYRAKLERMIEQIGKSDTPEALAKRRRFIEEYNELKEVLACLSE